MPLIANYDYEGLRKELATIGIVVLEEFSDGQVRWGDRPLPKEPGQMFKGRSVMTAPYFLREGKYRFDIFTVRNIVERLGKPEHLEALEKNLAQYMY